MKKKILLINPSHKILQTSKAVMRYEPPVAFLNLASFLYEKGYECDFINTAFEDINWNMIKETDYLLVGFTIFIGSFMKNAKLISENIKKIRPSLQIVYGGIMASLFPEEILKEHNIDFIVRYEGEYTLYELIESLEGKKQIIEITGLSYKDGNKIYHNPPRYLEKNLDNFPIPRWDLFGKYFTSEQVPYYYRIMSSKGCPFKCSFCYSHSIDEEIRHKSPVWRSRSVEHVCKELDRINKLTNTKVFTFGDDNFLVNSSRAIKILTYMKQKGYYIEQLISHMNNINDKIIDIMGGMTQTIIYAIETASPRLLKMLNKKLDIGKIKIVNKKLFDKGITTTHNFIVGLPTQTDKELRLNIELMMELKEINPYVRALAFLFLPLPFTPLYSYVEKEMRLELPKKLVDFESASFSYDAEEIRFRPWLTKVRYEFLGNYCKIFTDAFQTNNLKLSEESENDLQNDPKLREMFRGIEKGNRPKVFYRPYILDKILANKKIDLLNDLKNKI